MLSAPSSEQDPIEQYSINQLNNVLTLAFHFVDFKTPLLFKTDPSDKLVSSFKEKMLPELHGITITKDSLESFCLIDSAFSPNGMKLEVMNLAPFINADNEGSYVFMNAFALWIANQERFDMSYFMTALVKQVFMHCNLLGYEVNNYQLSLDLRASAVREQFHQLVLNHFARNLSFEVDPDSVIQNAAVLFEKDSLPAIYAERCFPAMIAELTQSEHFSLASALHNMFHIAKLYSMIVSNLNLNEGQLAAIYAPCFLRAFGLQNNIYTKKNGFSEEECRRIDKQWKLMAIILTHALGADDFEQPYDIKKEFYQSINLPFLLKKDCDMPDIPSVLAMLIKAEKLESVIALLVPINDSLLRRNIAAPNLEIGKKQTSILGRLRGARKRSKGDLETQLNVAASDKPIAIPARKFNVDEPLSEPVRKLNIDESPFITPSHRGFSPLYHNHQSTSSVDGTKDSVRQRMTRFPPPNISHRRVSLETEIWSGNEDYSMEDNHSAYERGDSQSAKKSGKLKKVKSKIHLDKNKIRSSQKEPKIQHRRQKPL